MMNNSGHVYWTETLYRHPFHQRQETPAGAPYYRPVRFNNEPPPTTRFSDKELEVALILVGSGRLRRDEAQRQMQVGGSSLEARRTPTSSRRRQHGLSRMEGGRFDVACDSSNASDTLTETEQKRETERKRRKELTSAFDELSALISRIEEEEGSPKKKRKFPNHRSRDALTGMTRVDIVVKTVETMQRLGQENLELKQKLLKSSERCKDETVVVMVPTLTPADDDSSKYDHHLRYSSFLQDGDTRAPMKQYHSPVYFHGDLPPLPRPYYLWPPAPPLTDKIVGFEEKPEKRRLEMQGKEK